MIKRVMPWFLSMAGAALLTAGPIHDLAEQGDVPGVVKLLMADPDLLASTNDKGFTPLQIAQAERREELQSLLGKMEKIAAATGHLRGPALQQFLQKRHPELLEAETKAAPAPAALESKETNSEAVVPQTEDDSSTWLWRWLQWLGLV